jgi:3-hydroxy acid dehydrogenase/malonic semialdehyde reductase
MTSVEAGLCGGTEFSEIRFHGDREKAAGVYAGTQPIMPEDIAETVYWVATLPAHVNINLVEMMPVCQAFGPLAVSRVQAPNR